MKNQTEEAYIARAGSEKGTGVFWIVEQGDLLVGRKEFVPDLTYGECIERGKVTEAFKWVPHSVCAYETLLATSCGAQGCG